MSVFEQIQANAETAIQELEAEIISLEEMIETHRQRIQNAKVQIQALKNFLNPEESSHEVAKSTKPRKNGKAHTETMELQ